MSADQKDRWALANRKSDTLGEAALRSALHRRGLGFRKNMPITLLEQTVRPDVVFPRARIAVFLDGCFWHCCPEHGRRPRGNRGYRDAKLDRNVARDRLVDTALTAAGWLVVRVWEHVDPVDAAATVAAAVEVATARPPGRSGARPPILQSGTVT